MSQFKKGDRVVLVRIIEDNILEPVEIGDSFIISEVNEHYDYPYSNGRTSFKADELVLESVYNSPLYKALS